MSQTTFTGTRNYIASPELMKTVDVAMALKKPLLIKGEPGTGKTMLAEAVAEALDLPLYIWNIKSTTKAQDGLYTYDTIQRLYDSQFGEEGVDDISHYIKLGKLGEAFKQDKQVVLLIDEMEFYIHETKETIKVTTRPIVIITSNAEKELPDAFLRRCIFHYIEFPEREQMTDIVHAHFENLEDHLLKEAMDAFYWIRSLRDMRKKPSTSELVDWIQALLIGGIDPEKIRKELPFLGVLVKKDEDLALIKERQLD